jgi:hypothetical protein
MSVANTFALLDDEGTLDASALAAKIPVSQKETVAKSSDGTLILRTMNLSAGDKPELFTAHGVARVCRSRSSSSRTMLALRQPLLHVGY